MSRKIGGMLPLTSAVFQILLVLTDGERHGYAIMKEVAANTQGQMQLGPGTLYRSIKRMLASGLIEESEGRPDSEFADERRRYYRLTPLGQRVATAEAERLASLVELAQVKLLLQGPQPVPSTGGV